MERLFTRAEAEVAAGRLPACQLAVACGDDVRAETFGTVDSARFVVFSLTKSLVAGAMWVLFSEDALSPATRVAEVIAEFGTNGKDVVTVEHLLTHTGGFPAAPMRPEEGATAAGRLARFEQWRLEWAPGSRTAYHPTSAHWVLAELIERAAGTDFRAFIAEHVVAPLGLKTPALGVPAADQGDIAQVTVVRDDDVAPERESSAFVAETADQWLLRYNEPEVLAIGVPGAGGVGSATDFARYFQAMLHNPGGLWDANVLQDATSVIRNTLPDPPTNVPANRTLGLKVAGDDGKAWLREFGRNTSARAFICTGAGGQVVWADPATGLSFCFLTNGIAADVVASFLRSSELSDLAALCGRQ